MIVSTERYERVVAERDLAKARLAGLEEANEILGDTVEWLQKQLAEKDAAILAMRREGFSPPLPVQEHHAQKPEPLHPEVRRAIESVAHPGEALYAELESEARQRLAHDGKPQDVAAWVRRGSGWSPYSA